MTVRMLIDATHAEETRVVVVSGNRLEAFDYESANRKQLKGNIYLAKVTRVEPSLQAAFVEYGGNRHGFLSFNEIHPDYYQIPVEDREALLEEEALSADAEAAREEAEVAAEALAAEAAEAEMIADDSESEADAADGDAEAGDAEAGDADADDAEADEAAEAVEAAAADEEPAAEETAPDETVADGETPETEVAAETEGGDDGIDAATIAAEAADDDEDEAGSGGDDLDEVPRRRPQRRYKIQEVIKRRQILLVQVVKEERGNKGAALTTYLSLAGRYCVLMPNTARGGGISRKITNPAARKKLKSIVSDLDLPEGMGVIVRTAGMSRTKTEIKRDFEYMLRAWDQVREQTLESTAPALVYEEANLITRAIRDLYNKDVEEILVEGEGGYRMAKDFMRTMQPSHAKRVQHYKERIPLLHRYQVDQQLDQMHSNVVQLKSGGYLVINPTEALVAIDVNSGRSTREHHIEETALKTNIEASDEVARQLRLRDLAGLIVIDYIDMSENRNNRAVERRLKEALKSDRARIQVGRISSFGLMEMSRQRLRTSLFEASTVTCDICGGSGHVRSTESTALHLLRAIEDEGIRDRAAGITLTAPTRVALYVLNQKRDALSEIEQRYDMRVSLVGDDDLVPPNFSVQVDETRDGAAPEPTERNDRGGRGEERDADAKGDGRKRRRRRRRPEEDEAETPARETAAAATATGTAESEGEGDGRKRRRRRRRRSEEEESQTSGETEVQEETTEAVASPEGEAAGEEEGNGRRRRRRGRRGGRRRREGEEAVAETAEAGEEGATEAVADEAQPVDAAEIVAQAVTPGDEDGEAEAVVEPEAVAPEADDDGEAIAEAAVEAEDEAVVETAPEPVAEAEVEEAAEPEPQTESETEEASSDDTGEPVADEAEEDASPLAADAGDEAAAVEEPEAAAPAISEPDAAEDAPEEEPRPKKRGWWRR